MNDEMKQQVLDCVMEIQRHLLKNLSADKSYELLKDKYDREIINIAMDLLRETKTNPSSPYKAISDTITRCMNKVQDVDTNISNVDEFYKICERAYKVFMNDKDGRGLPIVFLYNEGTKSLGIAPITQSKEERDTSPMDYLKKIVYSANPDAYCFCGEASMLKKESKAGMEKMKKGYKYGDIINDPNSEDVMIMQGNNKANTATLKKAFRISGKMGSLKFKEVEDFDKSESDKLP